MPTFKMAQSTPRGRRLVFLLLGDMFLGIAVGLLGYYALTNASTALQQRKLESAIPSASTAIIESSTPSGGSGGGSTGAPAARPMDFAGWAEQDEAYWRGLSEGEAFGRITADRIDLDAIVVVGTNREDLKKGPGWIKTTSLPADSGNCAISGHRTTYGHPFRRIDELQPGDEVCIYSPYRRYTYQVVETLIVKPSETEVIAPTVDPVLTLTACHPLYSARYRIVVQAKLVAVERIASPLTANR
ncbi:MAG: sortase [Coriobacteriia bacterium]